MLFLVLMLTITFVLCVQANKHTIILMQTSQNRATRTFMDYGSISQAMDGMLMFLYSNYHHCYVHQEAFFMCKGVNEWTNSVVLSNVQSDLSNIKLIHQWWRVYTFLIRSSICYFSHLFEVILLQIYRYLRTIWKEA